MSLRPDLLVLQEVSLRHCEETTPGPFFWTGSGHRGLAVISCTGSPLTLDPAFDPALPHFLPVQVGELHLLAVWASVLTSTVRYVRLIHRALDRYAAFVNHHPGILIGDLNSSTVFDAKHRQLNHTLLVERLGLLDYTSAWHDQTGERHGEESRPTFYMYRRPERTWHLDYAFLTQDLLPGARISIGPPEMWLPWSDHLPLIVDVPSLD
jgi:endonuclease/exonuclease/phosphatase family metal-dependent hydrolase